MKLKSEIITQIRQRADVRLLLRAILQCSESTLYARLKINDSSLLRIDVLKMLSERLGISIEDLIEEKENI